MIWQLLDTQRVVRRQAADVIVLVSDWVEKEAQRAGAGAVVYTADGTALCAYAARDLGPEPITRTLARCAAVRLAFDLIHNTGASSAEIRVPSLWLASELGAPSSSDNDAVEDLRQINHRGVAIAFAATDHPTVEPAREIAMAAAQRWLHGLPEPLPALSEVTVCFQAPTKLRVPTSEKVERTAELRDAYRLTAGTADVIETLLDVAREEMVAIWGSRVTASSVTAAISFNPTMWGLTDEPRGLAAVMH